MTIYYVNPVSGSNSNNGLAWGTAWKWPPGNGTTVLPGDEIRFAKSPYGEAAIARSGSSGFSQTDTNIVENVSVGSLWTSGGVAGTSISGVRLLINSGTTIPANTKLCYIPWTRTQTTRNGVSMTLMLVGIPDSLPNGNLKVVLCSDAAGNTPILTLDGPTAFNSVAFEGANCVFRYNNAATLNLTIGSLAIYSVASFTVNQAATIQPASSWNGVGSTLGSTIVKFTEDQSLNRVADVGYAFFEGRVYWGRADAVGIGSPWRDDAVPQGRLSTFTYISSGGVFTSSPFGREAVLSTTGSSGGIYAPLPYDQPISFYETPLAYQGTAGARIKFSGGWDTSTNTQDGYTNLNLGLIGKGQRKGSFVFSSGAGNYIDFENFAATGCTLVYYDYAVSSIAGLRFFNCGIGGWARVQTIVWPGFIGAATTAASVPVTGWYAERCALFDWFSASLGPCWSAGNWATNTQFHDSNKFVFDGVDIVDCDLSVPGYRSPTLNCPSGTVRIRTSNPNPDGSYPSCKAQIILSNDLSHSLTLATNSTASVEISKTIIFGPGNWTFATGGAGAVSASSITMKDWFYGSGKDTSSGSTSNIRIKDFKNTTLDGILFNNQYSGEFRLNIEYSATFHTNNPNAVFLMGDSFTSSVQYYASPTVSKDFLVLNNPPALVDGTAGPRPIIPNNFAPFGDRYFPAIIVTAWKTGTLKALKADTFYFDAPTYTAGTYWPNIPTFSLVDCSGKVDNALAPIGTVRVFGGQMIPVGNNSTQFGMRYTSELPFGRAVLAYGTKVNNVATRSNNVSWALALEKRSRAVQIRKADSLAQINISSASSSWGSEFYSSLIPLFIDLEETTPLNTTGESASRPRGILFRKPSGFTQWWYGNPSTAPMLTIASGTPNAYGKNTITINRGGIRLARVNVQANVTVVLTVRTKLISPLIDYDRTVAVTIAPSFAYASTIDNHYKKAEFSQSAQENTFIFYVTPQNTGQIEVYVFATYTVEVLDFTAVKA